MKKTAILFVIIFWTFSVNAQDTYLDSLLNLLPTQKRSPKKQLHTYENICQRLFSTFETEKSIEYGQKALELAQKEKDNLRMSAFNEFLGLAYNDKQIYDTAYIYYEKSLDKALISKDQNQILSVYLTLGAFHGQQSRFIEALEYFLKALPIAETLENKEKYLSILGNIGSIYTMINNQDKALSYFEQMARLSEKVNYYPAQLKSNYELGEIYILKNKYDEALKYTRKGLEISHTHQNKVYEILCLQSLSRIHIKKQPVDIDLALEYAKKSLDISNNINNAILSASALEVMSDVYLLQNRFKECEKAALEAYKLDPTNIKLNITVFHNLVKSNLFMGETEKASDYFDQYNKFKNQHTDKNMHEILLEMEMKYESEKKEMRIDALEKEKELYIWLTVAGGLILLLSTGMLIYHHRLNSQKHRIVEQQLKQLEQEKQLIATQSILEGETAERSRLARDLHDGLGSMLSVIRLNLRDMKSYSQMKESDIDRYNKGLEMLDKSIGELRRIAHHMMPESLIHHGLKMSLEDFCRAIPGAHFQYYGEDIRLDERLELILYRCAYELINNAVKHANANEINVQLIIDNALVSLTVQDNGSGFDIGSITPGSGLENVRKRVLSQNGKMNIYSTSGQGSEINIEIERI